MGEVVLPPVVYLECDYAADWPTWVPNPHEPPESGRTSYFDLDDVALSPRLRAALLAWQQRWMDVAPLDDPAPPPIDETLWARFIADGRVLAAELQAELGSDVEVRFRLGVADSPTAWT